MRSLLDINVLIALLDASHVMHDTATGWLEKNLNEGWASCPITQNGVIRIMSQPAYPNSHALLDVSNRLSLACAENYHIFWPDEVSILDSKFFKRDNILGHRQITDVYLLALAVYNEGRFVTFDKRVSVESVINAKEENLCLI